MDYQTASNRFNLDNVINKLNGLDFIDIIKVLNDEIGNAEFAKIPNKSPYKRDIEYLKTKYVSDLKGIAYLFSQGGKPSGVSDDTLDKIKPILLELIDKGQLKDGILSIYE